MPKQLTTQNATITTVAVEVKALTIGGKQVTLSVFRQLQEEALISSEGTLNGVPWGYVNYHPDRCGDDRRTHWHVVWQHGEELRRARVDCTPRFDPYGDLRRAPAPFRSQEAHQLLTSSVLEWLDGRRPDCPLAEEYSRYQDELTYKSGHEFSATSWASELAVTAANKQRDLDAATRWAAEEPGWMHNEEWIASREREAAERLAKARAEFDAAHAELAAQVAIWGRTHDELLADFRAACDEEAARRQRHRDVRATLAQLPQLFIAV